MKPGQILKLNSGPEIPTIGLGTWDLRGIGATQAVLWALEAGYRQIDTASMYGNEEAIAESLMQTKVPKKEIFVVTKLHPDEASDPKAALEASLQRLGLDYVDLYLVHWPPWGNKLEVWRQMEQLPEAGLAKSIGVSNYGVDLIQAMIDAKRVVPVVNQIEVTPFNYPRELIEYCQKQGIAVQVYSPLTRGYRLSQPQLHQLATKYARSPAQILIRWCLQHDLVVLPKSGQLDHIKENIRVFDFEITVKDMKLLDSLGTSS